MSLVPGTTPGGLGPGAYFLAPSALWPVTGGAVRHRTPTRRPLPAVRARGRSGGAGSRGHPRGPSWRRRLERAEGLLREWPLAGLSQLALLILLTRLLLTGRCVMVLRE